MAAAPLAPAEREMLARSPNSALGAPELFSSPEVRSGLAALSRMAAPGAEMAAIIRRDSRWHVRAALQARDWHRAAQGVRFLLAR